MLLTHERLGGNEKRTVGEKVKRGEDGWVREMDGTGLKKRGKRKKNWEKVLKIINKFK